MLFSSCPKCRHSRHLFNFSPSVPRFYEFSQEIRKLHETLNRSLYSNRSGHDSSLWETNVPRPRTRTRVVERARIVSRRFRLSSVDEANNNSNAGHDMLSVARLQPQSNWHFSTEIPTANRSFVASALSVRGRSLCQPVIRPAGVSPAKWNYPKLRRIYVHYEVIVKLLCCSFAVSKGEITMLKQRGGLKRGKREDIRYLCKRATQLRLIAFDTILVKSLSKEELLVERISRYFRGKLRAWDRDKSYSSCTNGKSWIWVNSSF